jgi:protein-tyrosine kinase
MSRLHEALKRASDGQAPIVPPEVQPPTGAGPDTRQAGFDVPWVLETTTPAEPEPARAARRPEPGAPLVSRLADWFRQHSSASGEKLVVSESDDKPDLAVAVEQYRKLAATLYYAKAEKGLKVIAVTSALPHEGKSLTATNLALTLSESYQHRVLVVDADLRRPSLHTVFGVRDSKGLSDWLVTASTEDPPTVDISANLAFLPSGHGMADPTSALTSTRMRALIDAARSAYDWVVLDTPPIGLVSDARLVSEIADGVVLVVEAGQTAYPEVQRAVSALERGRILGVVLNRVTHGADGYDSYHGYYRKSSKA